MFEENYHEDEFPALGDLKTLAKKHWGEEHPNDQSAFEDAFSNGIFHEHEPFWSDIALTLTDKQVVNLALAAIKPIIKGMGGDDADTKIAMEFYTAIYKWSRHYLKDVDGELFKPVEKFRAMMIRRAKAVDVKSWWVDTLRGLSLVELAIRGRLGMWGSPTSDFYDGALRSVIDKE